MVGVWSLKVSEEGGTVHQVCGTEDVLRTALAEYEASILQPDGVGDPIFKLTGFCDTADRAELTLVLRMDSIKGMSLAKLY